MGRATEALHWARLSILLQRGYEGHAAPHRIATTPDRMRAAYGEALRALWGEAEIPQTLPWDVRDGGGDTPESDGH